MTVPPFTTLKSTDTPQQSHGIWQWAKTHVNELTKWAGTVAAGLPPTGSRMSWHPGVAPPTGWLAEDGATMEVSNYPALFSVIGYTYGGSGTVFQLPNVPGSVIKY